MIGHQLFASELIGNLFYLPAVIFEIPKEYFIIKPPACWGADVSIEMYELLLLFSIINSWFTISCAEDVHLVKSESHSFLSDITTRIRHYAWKICATGDHLICSVDIMQWYMQPLNSFRLHSSNFCTLISKIPATMGVASLHAHTRKKNSYLNPMKTSAKDTV